MATAYSGNDYWVIWLKFHCWWIRLLPCIDNYQLLIN